MSSKSLQHVLSEFTELVLDSVFGTELKDFFLRCCK